MPAKDCNFGNPIRLLQFTLYDMDLINLYIYHVCAENSVLSLSFAPLI